MIPWEIHLYDPPPRITVRASRHARAKHGYRANWIVTRGRHVYTCDSWDRAMNVARCLAKYNGALTTDIIAMSVLGGSRG